MVYPQTGYYSVMTKNELTVGKCDDMIDPLMHTVYSLKGPHSSGLCLNDTL